MIRAADQAAIASDIARIGRAPSGFAGIRRNRELFLRARPEVTGLGSRTRSGILDMTAWLRGQPGER